VSQDARRNPATESARQLFAAEMRHWRAARNLSQRRLADLTHDSYTLIAKVETTERAPTKDLAERLDRALGTDGAFGSIWRRIERDAEIRSGRGEVDPGLGLEWSPTPASAVETVASLWRADLDRRETIVGAVWAAAALVAPSRRWFDDAADPDTSHTGLRRVGSSEVEVMWSMAQAFADADHHLGGGYARATLLQFLNASVAPLLSGTYDCATGRQVLTAAARLTGLGAFMCFDSGLHGLAQRYYIQSLRLAKAAGARALGAHILADMSIQAYDLGQAREALALAEAGHRAARDCGSPSTAARCSVLQARAHGLAGDAAATARAMVAAEQELVRADLPDEPTWIQFFNEEQLAAEIMYASHDLGRAAQVQQYAPTVLKSSAGMQRREVLAATTLAASYLPSRHGTTSAVDVELACKILTDALPSAAGLTSARGLSSINAVRRQLAPYRARADVQQVEEGFRQLAGVTT
jgi:transcriptional regulator with XRE-family HTH domain